MSAALQIHALPIWTTFAFVGLALLVGALVVARWPKRRNAAMPPSTTPTNPAAARADLPAWISALGNAAERLQTLWFTFLFVTLYFTLTVGATTHRMLFLEEGLALPLISLKLPLLGFYVVGPVFYLVFHLYLLMMLVLLARTAAGFNAALAAANVGEDERERLRLRLDNALFLQIVAGAKREREGANGFVLRAIALISIAIAPVVLLLMFQLMFLPYHSAWITWLHRILILTDLALIWTVWRSYRHHVGGRFLPDFSLSLSTATRTLATLAVTVFSVFMATFPSEATSGNTVAAAIDRAGRSILGFAGYNIDKVGYDGGRLSALLFGFEMPATNTEPAKRGLFPNRLWLPKENLVNDDAAARHALENRDFTGAVFREANLGPANLLNATLSNADFSQASLKGAVLEGVTGRGALFPWARMQQVRARRSDFSNGNFNAADLQGADFAGSILRGADFTSATLRGARLRSAHAEIAIFYGASLTTIDGRHLFADGADFSFADLRAANLDNASIQGSDLSFAKLQDASLDFARVWRSFGVRVETENAWMLSIQQGRFTYWDCAIGAECFQQWRDAILRASRDRKRDLERLEVLNPDTNDGTRPSPWTQSPLPRRSVDLDLLVRAIVCDRSGAPDVARRFIANQQESIGYPRSPGYLAAQRASLSKVAPDLKAAARSKPEETTSCPGGKGLTEEDLDQLEEITRPISSAR